LLSRTGRLQNARPGSAAVEIGCGERFGFGDNWLQFVSSVDEDAIAGAEESLTRMLGRRDLSGLRFLDAGSGSGLSSLVARRLGADVTSFDYDPASVSATEQLRRQFHPDDDNWTIVSGSVLDPLFLSTLGAFDVVYCWGVLHHTGSMYEGLEHLSGMVRPGGWLYIAIYNDQGWASGMWRKVKKEYNRAPALVRSMMVGWFGIYFQLKGALLWVLSSRPSRQDMAKKPPRGMSVKYDLVDWVGGYPFEVAKPEEIFEFCRDRGFRLTALVTKRGGSGCNQFVFQREGPPPGEDRRPEAGPA